MWMLRNTPSFTPNLLSHRPLQLVALRCLAKSKLILSHDCRSRDRESCDRMAVEWHCGATRRERLHAGVYAYACTMRPPSALQSRGDDLVGLDNEFKLAQPLVSDALPQPSSTEGNDTIAAPGQASAWHTTFGHGYYSSLRCRTVSQRSECLKTSMIGQVLNTIN